MWKRRVRNWNRRRQNEKGEVVFWKRRFQNENGRGGFRGRNAANDRGTMESGGASGESDARSGENCGPSAAFCPAVVVLLPPLCVILCGEVELLMRGGPFGVRGAGEWCALFVRGEEREVAHLRWKRGSRVVNADAGHLAGGACQFWEKIDCGSAPGDLLRWCPFSGASTSKLLEREHAADSFI